MSAEPAQAAHTEPAAVAAQQAGLLEPSGLKQGCWESEKTAPLAPAG